MLDLSSLHKAIVSLEKVIKVAERKQNAAEIDIDEFDAIKAGAIQNFEFTYELCWKLIKRWLEINLSPGMMEGITRKQLFRYASENFLIKDFDAWMNYHEMRNKTSYTYNQNTADEIYVIVKYFLADAKAVLEALEVRND
jgi:nucleotidyltransferase substrate binding protein (TIGR01987 family)